LRRELAEELVIVMRTYFEKPRTTVGWKGLINDPHLDGTRDIVLGLRRAREVLLAVSREGVPCATEALDPITPQYLSDLISWASIGARTTESQTHREMASGLSMPVGFKNGTDGSLDAAINALISAGHGHSFLGINADGHASVVKTSGNPNRHVVLRGGARPNYYREDVEAAVQQVARAAPELKRAVMVDTSHGNSSKDYRRQGTVCRDVVDQFVGGQSGLLGLLVESNLEEGRQDWIQGANLRYGTSITDACIGWTETEKLLTHVAEQVRSRPAAA
jgi:3-deoxy-7-phosphoheptulonate synthase